MIESARRESGALIVLTAILLLVVANFVAVSRTYRGQAVFFGSGADVFWFCLPLLVVFLVCVWRRIETESSVGHAPNLWIGNLVILGSFIYLVLYNIVRPLVENRHTSIIVALCVIVGRLTLGYLLVLGILFGAISTLTMRRADESNLGFEARRRNNMLRGAAILGGLGAILISLVGRPYRGLANDQAEPIWDEGPDCDSWTYENETDPCAVEENESEPQSYHEILGVGPSATKEELKQAYREKAKQYHPDKTAHLGPELQELAHRKTQQINEAYKFLMNDRVEVEERKGTP